MWLEATHSPQWHREMRKRNKNGQWIKFRLTHSIFYRRNSNEINKTKQKTTTKTEEEEEEKKNNRLIQDTSHTVERHKHQPNVTIINHLFPSALKCTEKCSRQKRAHLHRNDSLFSQWHSAIDG